MKVFIENHGQEIEQHPKGDIQNSCPQKRDFRRFGPFRHGFNFTRSIMIEPPKKGHYGNQYF